MISEKELKYSYKSWEVTFLTKIRKSLSVVPGRPVIFNCVTATEKVSEYLEDIVKHIMQDSCSCIKGSASEKIKNIGKITEGIILVTADVTGLNPSISHRARLEARQKKLSEKDLPKAPTEDTVRMTDVVLKNIILN